MTIKIHSIAELVKAFHENAEGFKHVFKTIADWFKTKAEETPGHLKNAAKVIHVILEGRKSLAKRNALGLDAGKSTTEYVKTWLGEKPNGRMMKLATVIPLIPESVFDTRDIGMLNTLGTIAGRVGNRKLLNTAVHDAKKIVVSGESKEQKTALGKIAERVVELPDGGWTYLSEAEFKEYQENATRAAAVSQARNASLDELLSVGATNVLADGAKKLTAEQRARALHHLGDIVKALESAPATPEEIAQLKELENPVHA